MSNPQMLMHHLEPLPSRRARHEQKFWLPVRSFRDVPAECRPTTVHARPTARQTGCAASLFHDQMLRSAQQASTSLEYQSTRPPSSNSMDLPTYLLPTYLIVLVLAYLLFSHLSKKPTAYGTRSHSTTTHIHTRIFFSYRTV